MMCGIAGIVAPVGQTVSEAILRLMTRTLSQRGPDDEGYYVDESGRCGLGHRRLSIIDLGGGHQPMANQDGQIRIVVNGEIYNFRALRDELEGKGFRFRTASDSEVIAHGYQAFGEGLFERLEGMFAFAIWDRSQRRLLLGRDRFGEKPLYYALTPDGHFLFGSELSAVCRHPALKARVSPAALGAYLVFECFPDTRSVLEGVEKLRPGSYLSFDADNRQVKLTEYWPKSGFLPPVGDATVDSAAKTLRAHILRSTEARLVADVPVGIFLSGGIDSSTIAAAACRLQEPKKVKTFSITFEDPSFDEGVYAREVAAHLGVDHHEERLAPKTMIDLLPEVMDNLSEPLGDASVIPTFLLSRFARKHVKVALGGDGGDELFLGYPTFQADRVARVLDRVLGASRQSVAGRLSSWAQYLPVSRKNFSLDFQLKRFLSGLGYEAANRHQAWMGSFLPEEVSAVLHPDVRAQAMKEHPYAVLENYPGRSGWTDQHQRIAAQYLRFYLAGDVLVKVDRMSMANGLEVRAPFLDTTLAEYALSLPAEWKLRGFTTKHVLKEAVRPWLPSRIVDRKKKGFGIPIAEWLRGPLRDWARALLNPERLGSEGYFDPTAVTALLDAHERGLRDHRKPLWTLLVFQMWLERFQNASPARASGELAA
jgi:asparagine synthase (glutamine-hydrolysing)